VPSAFGQRTGSPYHGHPEAPGPRLAPSRENQGLLADIKEAMMKLSATADDLAPTISGTGIGHPLVGGG
jgi:hypothetical protein